MKLRIQVLAVLTFLAACAGQPQAASPPKTAVPPATTQGFTFELDSPHVRISIPDLPAIQMGPHPLAAARPHLRGMGTLGPYTVSVITPTADAGMSPVACASSTATSIMRRYALTDTSAFRGRANDHTFVLVYGLPQKGFVQLNAHILSAADGTHCVEVHASKISTDPADAGPWMRGFGTSNIEDL